MRTLYKLDENRNPVLVTVETVQGFYDWAAWMAESNVTVARTELHDGQGVISTVFIGRDMSITVTGKPVLFETMCFGGPFDGDVWRYTSWAEAEAGHAAVLALHKTAQDETE